MSAPPVRVVVADPLAGEGLAILREAGFEVVEPADSAGLSTALADGQALLVRSATRVTAELIAAAPGLRLVGRAGTGVDNIDVNAATRRGIVVMNTPDANSIAAAEQTLALILALVRNLVPAARSLSAGEWKRSQFLGTELAGKTLGVLGFGRIGREVAKRALAFEMRVLAFDPFVAADLVRQLEAEPAPLEEVLRRADLVTLHLPLTRDTRHILNAERIALMKKGARLINCARGGLVDEDALLAALESGSLAGAALDVFENEPPRETPLLAHPRAVVTPHLGASTVEAQQNVSVELAGQVRDFFRSGVIRGAVNMPSLSAEALQKVSPYLDLATRLGALAGSLRDGAIRELRFEYLGEPADLPLPPITLAGLMGCLATRAGDSVNFVNVRAMAAEQGIEVSESFHEEVEDFSNLVRVRLTTDQGAVTLGGTIVRQKEPRLVQLDGYDLDAVPAGPLLILENDDVPGVVGVIGTLLGGAGVNIARISWGRAPGASAALTVIQLDSEASPEVLSAMAAHPRVRWVRAASLPPSLR